MHNEGILRRMTQEEAVLQILEQADVLLDDVKCYSAGASAEIRVAIQQPNNKDAQRAALDILDKLVTRIRAYYELSQRIEQIVPLLLWELCSGKLLWNFSV